MSPTGRSLAVVNLKPLVPGHVLVLSADNVTNLTELDDEAHADLWRAARAVHALVVAAHGAEGANVAVQDGACAGQRVPHVHVHILPS